jgi:hypothetical protein
LQPVQVMAPAHRIGTLGRVEITAIGTNSLFGEPIDPLPAYATTPRAFATAEGA